jgi:hypothetical protein
MRVCTTYENYLQASSFGQGIHHNLVYRDMGPGLLVCLHVPPEGVHPAQLCFALGTCETSGRFDQRATVPRMAAGHLRLGECLAAVVGAWHALRVVPVAHSGGRKGCGGPFEGLQARQSNGRVRDF